MAVAVDTEPCAEGLFGSNPRFRRLWGAQTVSVFGDAITGIAVPTVAVLSLHASALGVGALGSIGNVAGAAIAPRLSRRLGTGPSLVLSTLVEGSAILLAPLGTIAAP